MRKALCALVLVPLFGIPSWSETSMRVQVPFSFEVNNKSYPAAEYEFSPALWCQIQIVNTKSNRTTTACDATRSVSLQRNQPVKLVFHRYGSRNFLREVWFPNSVRQLARTRNERELVTSKLTASKQPARVEVPAGR